MRIKNITAILLILGFVNTSAQYQYEFQNPKTPEAYQMDKYGKPDINLYTGRPNINIPLYSIKFGNLLVPLQLTYNSNGIRADEEASRVGLGWYMETPMITQIINGYDDLTLPIVRTKYYYNYKPAYLVDPQPLWWYQYRQTNPNIATGNVPERLNISNSMISDPTQHLNEGFIGKLSSDGGGIFQHMGTYLPMNGQLQSYYFVPLNQAPTLGYDFDVEMDFFKASFYGHNLLFYKMPNTNSFYVLNKKGYKVEMTKIDTYHFSWLITTPNGEKYTFSQQTVAMLEAPNLQTKLPYLDSAIPKSIPEYSASLMPSAPTYPHSISNRTWQLSKIQDIHNNSVNYIYKALPSVKADTQYSSGKCRFLNIFSKTVDQQYYPGSYEKLDNIITSSEIPASTGSFIYCDKNYRRTFQENSIPEKIIFGNSQVEFNTASRQDKIYDERIESLVVKNNGRIINTIDFNVSYYPENHVLSKRMKLDSIQINGKRYKFEYNSNSLSTKYADYWGYFNGLNNSTPYTNPFRLFKDTSTIPTWAQSLYDQTKDTENKSAHPENIKVGILDKIIYPTGGYTKYDYELNTFDNLFFPNYDNKITSNKNAFTVNHLNIDTNFSNRSTASFNVNTGDQIKGTISLINGISGSCPYTNSTFKMVKIPDSWIAQYNSGVAGRENFWYVVDHGYITVETIYSKTGFTSLNDINFSINITTDATIAARVKFDESCPSTGAPKGSIKATFGTTIFKDYQQTYSQGYGLRVKKTSDYNENGLQTINEYTYSGGKHISPFNPVTDEEIYNTYYLEANTQPSVYYKRYSSSSNLITSSNTSIFQTNALGNGDFVGYDKVTIESKSSNNLSKGKVVHNFVNIPDVEASEKFGNADGTTKSEMNLFGRGFRKSDLENGKDLLIETYDLNNSKIREVKNFYIPSLIYDDGTKTCYNIAVRNIRTEGAVFGGNSPNAGNVSAVFNTFNRTNLYFYPLKGSETLLSTSTLSEFTNGNELKTKNDYTYNGLNLVSYKSTIIPSADQYSEQYTYSLSNSKLLAANILNSTIGKETYKNGKLTYSQTTKFDDVNHLNPTSITTMDILNSQSTKDVAFDKYDTNGNLVQFTGKDGVPITIVWGYNLTQPIAKIEDMTYDQLISTVSISEIISASDNDASDPTKEDLLVEALNNFRKNAALSGKSISTYTYDPLIGVTSITPPSGVRQAYKYDALNRLKEGDVRIKNSNGNYIYKKVSENNYNYKP